MERCRRGSSFTCFYMNYLSSHIDLLCSCSCTKSAFNLLQSANPSQSVSPCQLAACVIALESLPPLVRSRHRTYTEMLPFSVPCSHLFACFLPLRSAAALQRVCTICACNPPCQPCWIRPLSFLAVFPLPLSPPPCLVVRLPASIVTSPSSRLKDDSTKSVSRHNNTQQQTAEQPAKS